MEYGGIYDNSQSPYSQTISQWLEQKGQANIFSDLNIGYVILAKEEDSKSYLWLDDLAELEKVQETDNLILYQVKNAK